MYYFLDILDMQSNLLQRLRVLWNDIKDGGVNIHLEKAIAGGIAEPGVVIGASNAGVQV